MYVFVYANVYARVYFCMHSGLWLDYPGKGYYAWDDSNVSPRYRLKGIKVWRHLALQFGRYVYMYIFMYICIHISMYICIHLYICIYTYLTNLVDMYM